MTSAVMLSAAAVAATFDTRIGGRRDPSVYGRTPVDRNHQRRCLFGDAGNTAPGSQLRLHRPPPLSISDTSTAAGAAAGFVGIVGGGAGANLPRTSFVCSSAAAAAAAAANANASSRGRGSVLFSAAATVAAAAAAAAVGVQRDWVPTSAFETAAAAATTDVAAAAGRGHGGWDRGPEGMRKAGASGWDSGISRCRGKGDDASRGLSRGGGSAEGGEGEQDE